MTRSARTITAQVAVEYIANDPGSFDPATIEAVRTEATEAGVAKFYMDLMPAPEHDCFANPVPYVSDGALGHGWECGLCGSFLQAG